MCVYEKERKYHYYKKKKKVELLNKVTAVEFVLLPAASLTELSCSVARAGRA